MTHWHVIQTIGMRERWVGAELNRVAGVDWYVPLERRKIVNRARTIEQLRPLMPGYVFVHGLHAEAYRAVNDTKHVREVLDGLIHPLEIATIRELEADHNRALEDWRTFKAGDRVRAKSGPFGSIQSLLLAVRGRTATIEVPMLGSKRTAKVKLDDLEKVA